MKRQWLAFAALIVSLTVSAASPALAQSTQSSIVGIVTDQSGSAVPTQEFRQSVTGLQVVEQ